MNIASSRHDRLIPWYFVLFFLFIALVDGTMVTLALRGYSGTVTEHPYEKGLAYNEVVKAEAAQAALGWQGHIEFSEGELTFTLYNHKNIPVNPEKVEVKFSRPAQAGINFNMALHSAGAGIWKAKAHIPLKGLWEVRVYARQKETLYQQSQRIVVE